MNLATTKLTYHDYLLLPDDGKRYEILDGDLFVTPSPVTRHQLVVGRFLHHLMTYLETNPIGTVFTAPYDVVLSETDILEPDLILVLTNGRARITEKNVQGPPDIVMEVLSPGTAARDRGLKHKRYERFGVQEYWLVDPDQNSLEILALQDGTYVHICRATRPTECASPLLPGLVLNLARLLE
ncbi:MAG: Uma2 family endonuclease [Nitrospira sp. CG24E]|nr:MAG: Uma2 family endonuclease [Nitrospira sp. CG24E]